MLRPYYISVEEGMRETERIQNREARLLKEILSTFPEEVEGKYSLESLGGGLIRVFIRLPENAPKESTDKAKSFLNKMFGKSERLFREIMGEFAWKGSREAKDEDGEYIEMVFVECAHKGLCEIRQVTRTVTRYEAVCPKED